MGFYQTTQDVLAKEAAATEAAAKEAASNGTSEKKL